MTKLPHLTAVQLINHPGEKLDRGLLLKIIKKDIEISREEFERLL